MDVAVADLRDIRKISQKDLESFFIENGEKSFRGKQVTEWLWQKSATSFDEMSNLPKGLRELMARHFVLRPIQVSTVQKSNDGTIKSAFKLWDNHTIEGVLIPAEERMTACVSSQVGCSLTCKFCATGYMERKRNLDPGEIYDQVVTIAKQAEIDFGQKLSNIVFMGMGEPLLNYANVLESIEKITSPAGLNMAAKRITVSTAGIAKMIIKLADDGAKFNLALSLHAADDVKRNQIMPINESNNLPALEKALQYWFRKTRNPVTFEYILFYKFNDSFEDAKNLLKICRKVPSKVNIIEYNPIAEADFQFTDPKTLDNFAGFLEDNGVVVNVRRSRGKDIDAACGQLANKH